MSAGRFSTGAVFVIVMSACAADRTLFTGPVSIRPDELFLEAGDTVALALVGPGGLPVASAVAWTVSDRSIAEVSATGVLRAITIGITEVEGSSGSASATAAVTVGPLIVGAWYGESDTVLCTLHFNKSASPSGFTGLGAIKVGAPPSVLVSALGSAFRDSVQFTATGDSLEFEFAGRMAGANRISGTAVVNGSSDFSFTLQRMP